MDVLTLIQEGSYGWLAFLLCLIYGAWTIDFKLSYKIVGEKFLPTAYIAILLMVTYVSFARPFLSHLTFVLLMAALMVTLLCIFGRLRFFSAIYATVFPIFISFIGDIFLLFVLLALFPKLIPFMFGTKWGFLIMFGFETLCPIIALSITNPKFSLRLPLRKTVPFDFFDMSVCWILVCVYYATDYAMTTALEAFKTNPEKVNSSLGFLFMTSFGTITGIILLIRCMKYMHDQEIKRLQDENDRIETEKNILMADLKKYRVLDNLNNEQQLGSLVNDYTVKIFDIALEVAKSSIEKPKKPSFIPNEINLRKLGLNSKNGEISGWIALDLSYAEIGDKVHLSESAVKSRASDMLKKFGLKNREELAKFTIENELIKIIDE